MIKIVQAEEAHFDSLDLKEVFEHKDAVLYAKMMIGQGHPAFALMLEEKCIGVIGGIFIYPHVMEACALFSKSVTLHPIAFHRTVAVLLDKAFENFKVHRIQIVVREDYSEGNKWAYILGFNKEGTMKKYGPTGLNYNLYAAVR